MNTEGKDKRRAVRRKRNLHAKELLTNKQFRPKVVKPKAEEDDQWKQDLEEYYANRDEGGRPISETFEGGAQQGERSEDLAECDWIGPGDWEETQREEEEQEVNVLRKLHKIL